MRGLVAPFGRHRLASKTCLEQGGRCSMRCLQEKFCKTFPCTCTRACTSTLARAPCGPTTTCGKAQVSAAPLEAPIWQRQLKHLSHMLCARPHVPEMASCPCREGGAVCGAWSKSHARSHPAPAPQPEDLIVSHAFVAKRKYQPAPVEAPTLPASAPAPPSNAVCSCSSNDQGVWPGPSITFQYAGEVLQALNHIPIRR